MTKCPKCQSSLTREEKKFCLRVYHGPKQPVYEQVLVDKGSYMEEVEQPLLVWFYGLTCESCDALYDDPEDSFNQAVIKRAEILNAVT